MKLTLALLVFLFGQGADLISTYQALHRGYVEGNPVLAPAPYAFKIVGVGALTYFLVKEHTHHPKVVRWVLIGGGVVGLAAAAHNWSLPR